MSSQRQQDVDALLADLSAEVKPGTKPPAKTPAARPPAKGGDEAQSLLDDLEGMVQRRRSTQTDRYESPRTVSQGAQPLRSVSQAEQGTRPHSASQPPTPTKPIAPVRSIPTKPAEPAQAAPAPAPAAPAAPAMEPAATSNDGSSWSQWGGSLFSNATRMADQARLELERRAASVVPKTAETGADQPIQELGTRFAHGFRGFVREAGLESIGQNLSAAGRRGWTDIVNAVAPPMEGHETVDVTLSHDMAGYSGIEPLVFQVLSRVLQQADITKVAVHMTASSDAASTELPKTAMHVSPTRAEGIAHAKSLLLPLAEAAKPDAEKDEGDATCPIVLRIQPFFEEVLPSDARNLFHKPAQAATQQDERSVSFLSGRAGMVAYVPWPNAVSVPLEHNAWVEQAMSDAIEGALAVVAQSRRAAFTESLSRS